MRIFTLLLAIMLLSFSIAQANATTSSALIKNLNAEFGNLEGFPPILILDPDEIDARFALAGVAYADGDDRTDALAEQRIKILKDYVADVKGITMKDNDVFNLELMHSFAQSASAYQWKANFSTADPYLCTVIPPSFDTNKAQTNIRMLQLDNKEIHPKHNYAHLTETMSREEAELYSILHEVGHCLDRKYLPNQNSYEPSAAGVHTTEAYAEIFGGLLMAKKGYTDIFKRRAMFRMAYSWKITPYFHNHPELSFGNPVMTAGGTIYALHRPLTALDQWLKKAQNAQSLSTLTPDEIEEVTTDIVENFSYPSPQFAAIHSYFGAEDKGDYLEVMRERATRLPEVFIPAMKQLNSYLDLGPKITAELLSDKKQRQDFSNKKVHAQINLSATAKALIQSCKTYKNDTRIFLTKVRATLRPQLFNSSGYNVADINQKLKQAPVIAQARLKSLSCIK